MRVLFEWSGKTWQCDLDAGRSIAIGVDFEGLQPNHFGAARAERQALVMGGFIGDTRRGGSCNVDAITMIPHCNGTHTETVGHLVDQEVKIGDLALPGLLKTVVITVAPSAAVDCQETYRPDFLPDDQVLTQVAIEHALKSQEHRQVEAVVVRTLPNGSDKRSRSYGAEHEPAFFTCDAISWLRDFGCQHLLVDLPSIDRMHDDGHLTNHHLFWRVPEGQHQMSLNSCRDRTITEMVFVPDSIDDGYYLLNLQVPAFGSDAAPSRPVLYGLEAI